MSLCPYSNVFGASRTGVHAYRTPVSWGPFGDIAIVDTLLTIAAAWFLKGRLPFVVAVILFFIVGELLHIMFCVDSTIAVRLKKFWSGPDDKTQQDQEE